MDIFSHEAENIIPDWRIKPRDVKYIRAKSVKTSIYLNLFYLTCLTGVRSKKLDQIVTTDLTILISF